VGRPLEGVRVLALEQMQSLPFATQLLSRLGADVVKVEPPPSGELGRSSQPAMTDPEGRSVGATFLRNNLGKRSLVVNLKDPRGRELLLRLAPRFDVVAENFKSGAAARLGLSFEDLRAVHPSVVYLSVSGFGTLAETPYRDWPALAIVVEAMSGLYEAKRRDGEPPETAPAGALGDISAALFATVGVLAALRLRDRTGEAQYVDVAMLDAVLAMTDVIVNYWSLGVPGGAIGPLVSAGFRAADGWFVLQVSREAHFEALAGLLGRPEWVGDPRFATRQGWVDHQEEVLRPAIEAWASGRTKVEACEALAAAGIAAGPCFSEAEVATDRHVAARRMLVPMARTDGVERPVLAPGNPVKLLGVPDVEDGRVPWVGEHTDEVLREELGLGDDELAALRVAGVL
jgi:crotonobetainyl-CoA:carnitine CoA-transferase CaiB-like acyl-CoA transferase